MSQRVLLDSSKLEFLLLATPTPQPKSFLLYFPTFFLRILHVYLLSNLISTKLNSRRAKITFYFPIFGCPLGSSISGTKVDSNQCMSKENTVSEFILCGHSVSLGPICLKYVKSKESTGRARGWLFRHVTKVSNGGSSSWYWCFFSISVSALKQVPPTAHAAHTLLAAQWVTAGEFPWLFSYSTLHKNLFFLHSGSLYSVLRCQALNRHKGIHINR